MNLNAAGWLQSSLSNVRGKGLRIPVSTSVCMDLGEVLHLEQLGFLCIVLYLYIYIALLAVRTNQKRFQCERPI